MPLLTANICFDCADPRSLAQWWSTVLDDYGRTDAADWSDDEAELIGPGGRCMVFLKVPEAKAVKNRVHLCLRAAEGSTRDDEVERLLALGAMMVDDRRGVDDGSWAVLADPEGNEFCVLSRTAEEAGIRVRSRADVARCG